MTGPEHYREAERLLAQADGHYMDDSSDPLPREEYASDEEWAHAMEEAAEAHELSIRTAALFAQMAAGHATLALAAISATNAFLVADGLGYRMQDLNEWQDVSGTKTPLDGAR